MQDKALLQEEMCAFMSRLVHVFSHPDNTLLFIQVFLQTEAREWNGTDRWRMDKFMMLFRNMLTQSLEFLKKQKWKKSLITKFTDILSNKIMNIKEDTSPDGLKIHFTDIYLDELERVGAEELPPGKVWSLLAPFSNYIQNSRNGVVVGRVVSRVFDAIIQQTVDDAMTAAEKQIEKEEGNSDEEENIDEEEKEETEDPEDTEIPPRLQFDFKAIADELFQLGSNKDCVSKNRNRIYRLVKRFQDLNEGILPKEKIDEEEGDILKKKDISLAVQRLENLEVKKKKKKKKKKKNNLQNENEGSQSGETENLNSKPETKKVKRKSEDLNTEPSLSPEKKKKEGKKGLEKKENKNQAQEVSPKLASANKTGKQKKKLNNVHEASPEVKVQGSKKKSDMKKNETVDSISNSAKKGSNNKNTDTDHVNDSVTLDLSLVTSAKKKKGNKYSAPASVLSESMGDNSTPSKSKNKLNDVSFDQSMAEVFNNVSNDITKSEQVITVKSKKKRKSSVTIEESVMEEKNVSTPSSMKCPKSKSSEAKMMKLIEENTINSSPTSEGFAKFDTIMKTPPAFVRKSVNKLKTPKSAVKKQTLEAPTSCPDSKKKVIFNMKKNDSISFQDSINSLFSPGSFNPTKTADHGILKTPSPAMTRSQSFKKRRASTGVIKQKRPKAADFF
ncbi:ribosomal RNA-processing protein 1 [Mytilus galloprovincialis]|uniref:Ribosomal RNA-processing protein 1 n=1 Tax=Mytilus galloprovincialis TaxID=29158 RepID=A0A8B6FEL3_MYTGA|nr:ribosomal RNA-processing protein 1 [Mytilus galloprovincialis]